MKINLFGNIMDSSGYAVHTRQLLKGLLEIGEDVSLQTSLPQGWELGVNDAELAAIKKPKHKEGVSVFIGMPPYWPVELSNRPKKFVGYVVWEGDKIPRYWLDNIYKADAVIVPSTHTRDAVLAAEENKGLHKLLEKKLFVVPHGVDVSMFKEGFTKEGTFNFLVNKGWAYGENDRGGVQYALKAFSEEFSKEEDVVLRIKINPAYNRPGWDFGVEISKLDLDKDRPAILVEDRALPYDAMPNFYKGGHVFVNPTRAEAFSIPCLEAMACGIPVITTRYGGQTDFVTEENGWLVDYELDLVDHDVMYEDVQWAIPHIPHLRKLMRHVFENREVIPEKGKLAQETAWQLTWRNSAELLINEISKL